jgi:hypothetical protein
MGRQGGEDIERKNAVELLRGTRKCTHSSMEAGFGDVCAEEIDLLSRAASRIDGKVSAGERLRDIDGEEALDSVYGRAETAADSSLCICDEATAACADFKDALARLQVSAGKCGDAIRAVDVVYVVILTDYVCERGGELRSRVEDDYGEGGEDRVYQSISMEEEGPKRETYHSRDS